MLLIGYQVLLKAPKRRCSIDYLTRLNLDLNHPGFDSLREFVSHELSVMPSDYAQMFFGSGEKDKPRDCGYGRASVRVRHVAMKLQDRPFKEPAAKPGSGVVTSGGPKVCPLCFVCDDSA